VKSGALNIEKADHELVLQQRHGKAGAGIQRRGTRPFTFKTTFGEVTVQRSRISHTHDGTIEVPSAIAWNTYPKMGKETVAAWSDRSVQTSSSDSVQVFRNPSAIDTVSRW